MTNGFGTYAFASMIAAAMIAAPQAGTAAPLAMVDSANPTATIFEQVMPEQNAAASNQAGLQRQVIAYTTREPAGTVVVDTPNRALYFVLGGNRAIRYAIGVGREGFTWSGVQSISRKAEWPDWTPPPEMIERQKYLPRWMAGGPGNPLGARALYLGNTQYRIHGTNDPTTIGKKVSSGCIRLTNEDVSDLYSRVTIGSRVVVLPEGHPQAALGRAARSEEHRAQPQLTANTTTRAPARTNGTSAFGLY